MHDPFLSAPAHGAFLASEFKNNLSPDMELESGELFKGQVKIAPLILMTIEELENLESSMKYFGFREFLSDYSKSCPNRMMSINNHIYYSSYRNKLRQNRNLANQVIDLLHLTGNSLFPVDFNKE